LKIKVHILFIICLLISFKTLYAEEWGVVRESGKGSITVFYYNSDNFISDASGQLKGIEYDIFLEFKKYLKMQGVDLIINFKKADSFSGLYDEIKHGGSGEFGACSFSMTAERMKEISFSPKYMPDIEVLINSKNIPIAKDEEEFKEIFSKLTALNVANTTFEEDLIRLNIIVTGFKIQRVKTASIIRERILEEPDLFGYIELPTYLKLFQEGIRFKRQNLFKVERNGYGIILPKNSTWLEPMNDFFNSVEFKLKVNQIIKKHLGEGVNELLWKIESSENGDSEQEITLLTMEREAQEMEIKQQGLKVQILIGGVAVVLIIAFLLFYGYRMKKSVNKSLTDRNRLIEEQKSELARLSIVAEKMNEAVVITDATGEVEYYNHSLVRNSGFTEDEFKIHFKDLLHLQKLTNRDDIQEIIDGFKTNPKPFLYDSQHSKKDGSTMWTAASLSPVYGENKELSKIIVVYTDIDKSKEFSNQLLEKNREITDSINYAQRIQDAILPSMEFFKSFLPNSFVMFRPKDVLSGDFYWVSEAVNNKDEQLLLAAVADCTGHGVPGALMSIIGNNYLRLCEHESTVNNPGEGLDFINRGVSKTLRQEFAESTIKDGMDISFIALDYLNMKLYFAGAKTTMYVISEKELSQYKGDKHPVGAYVGEELIPFTSNEIDIKKGDLIYLFSDGYADQFGGQSGKKFMYKRFRELILSISHLEMGKQKESLEVAFDEWRGDLDQLDDVCVMGIKV
jgi:PAS domain S-box-containing protein